MYHIKCTKPNRACKNTLSLTRFHSSDIVNNFPNFHRCILSTYLGYYSYNQKLEHKTRPRGTRNKEELITQNRFSRLLIRTRRILPKSKRNNILIESSVVLKIICMWWYKNVLQIVVSLVVKCFVQDIIRMQILQGI